MRSAASAKMIGSTMASIASATISRTRSLCQPRIRSRTDSLIWFSFCSLAAEVEVNELAVREGSQHRAPV